jgi:hypothetical protein
MHERRGPLRSWHIGNHRRRAGQSSSGEKFVHIRVVVVPGSMVVRVSSFPVDGRDYTGSFPIY